MGKNCDYISLISSSGLDPYGRIVDFSKPEVPAVYSWHPKTEEKTVAAKDVFIRDEDNVSREFQSLLKTT